MQVYYYPSANGIFWWQLILFFYFLNHFVYIFVYLNTPAKGWVPVYLIRWLISRFDPRPFNFGIVDEECDRGTTIFRKIMFYLPVLFYHCSILLSLPFVCYFQLRALFKNTSLTTGTILHNVLRIKTGTERELISNFLLFYTLQGKFYRVSFQFSWNVVLSIIRQLWKRLFAVRYAPLVMLEHNKMLHV
jgi:hypothetical protein